MTRLRTARLLARTLRRLRRDDAERGIALASVIGLGMVLLLLSVTMVAVAVSGSQKSRTDSDWNAAIAAAYAGVEDYKSKLANDNAYSQYGARVTSFSTGSTFRGTDGNRAFGAGPSGPWQSVGDGTDAAYRYEVDNSSYTYRGALRLRATGRVGDTTRTVVADLKQDGFIDYVYFTDYEMSDPVFSSSKCKDAYEWAVSSRPNCTTIQFAKNDVIEGPLHTNDTMVVCGGTQFKGVTTTASTRPNRYLAASGTSCTGTPDFGGKATPGPAPRIELPETNDKMRLEVRSDLPTTVPDPGCLYTGPTSITLLAGGKMTVRSPWTKKTRTTADPTKGSAPAACGTPGAARGSLGGPGGQTLDVPANNLVFVQNVPAVKGDANYSASAPEGTSCTGADGVTPGNGVGFPVQDETGASYSCTAGDVFVQGTLTGTLTIAASNYVYVTGDVTYSDVSTDVLGLVGENAVIVHNPVKTVTTTTTVQQRETYSCGRYGWDTCERWVPVEQTRTSQALLDRRASDRVVQAAVLSVLHTFTVQNYNLDSGHPKGALRVFGSISQKYRGPVATTGSTGYTKAYVYDARLRYTAPPKFLSPVSTTYGITHVVESKTAVDATGTEIAP